LCIECLRLAADSTELKLKQKSDPRLIRSFSVFNQRDLDYNVSVKFDMRKLEDEYDYDTDEATIKNGRRILDYDLFYAVEFFV
jgi:hypothetical protein